MRSIVTFIAPCCCFREEGERLLSHARIASHGVEDGLRRFSAHIPACIPNKNCAFPRLLFAVCVDRAFSFTKRSPLPPCTTSRIDDSSFVGSNPNKNLAFHQTLIELRNTQELECFGHKKAFCFVWEIKKKSSANNHTSKEKIHDENVEIWKDTTRWQSQKKAQRPRTSPVSPPVLKQATRTIAWTPQQCPKILLRTMASVSWGASLTASMDPDLKPRSWRSSGVSKTALWNILMHAHIGAEECMLMQFILRWETSRPRKTSFYY